MDQQELKKFLAGLSIAGLLAGTTLMASGCASAGAGTQGSTPGQAPVYSS